MPTATGGLVEITLKQRNQQVDVFNVFHYWDSSQSAITDMAAIATGFNSNVANRLATLTTTAVQYQEIKVRDVFGQNPDFVQLPSDPNGNIVDETLPVFNAVRVDYIGATKETRRGYKRFAGIPETHQQNGDLTAAALALWIAEEASFLQQIIVGGISYQPVIFGGPTKTNPTRSVVNIVNQLTTRDLLTSQSSRKP